MSFLYETLFSHTKQFIIKLILLKFIYIIKMLFILSLLLKSLKIIKIVIIIINSF